MTAHRLTKLTGGTLATALVLTGVSLGFAAPASAAEYVVFHDDIATSESDATYLGWHEGDASDVSNSFAVKWDGLHLGSPNSTQVLHGIVAGGTPGVPVTLTDLRNYIDNSAVNVLEGIAFHQVAITTDAGWTTIRPVTGASGFNTPDPAVDMWTSSQNIGTIVANAPVLLETLITELDSQGDLRYSGFGLFANASDPAIVRYMTFANDAFHFEVDYEYIDLTSEVIVTEEDIRPNEDTYPGWHEGYVNATPAYSVEDDGLHFGDGANSQIINGLNPPIADADLYSLLYSAGLHVESGEAFFQIPMFYGPADLFTTIRPAVGAGPGVHAWVFNDLWVSSSTIPATPNTDQVPANTPVLLGDLIEALTLQGGPADVLAFGVLAQAATPTVVSQIDWNGVSYLFQPAEEVLPATGADVTVSTVAAALLLLVGLGAIVFTRRKRGQQG